MLETWLAIWLTTGTPTVTSPAVPRALAKTPPCWALCRRRTPPLVDLTLVSRLTRDAWEQSAPVNPKPLHRSVWEDSALPNLTIATPFMELSHFCYNCFVPACVSILQGTVFPPARNKSLQLTVIHWCCWPSPTFKWQSNQWSIGFL